MSMPRRLALLPGLLVLVAASALGAGAADDPLARGLVAIHSMAGCYLVDYSYVEIESLQPGYAGDARVYDVNREKPVKEWITAEVLSPRRVRLQRILFFTDLRGTVRDGSEIKHQTEDWEYDAPFLYEFVAPRTWQVRDLKPTPGLWTRRGTNLGDRVRHPCAGARVGGPALPRWSCSDLSALPGPRS